MKLSLPCLLALTLVGLSPAAAAQVTNTPVSDEDKAVFNELYREKLSTVNRTRSTADDLALAKEMMALAKDVPDDPGVQCLIYIEVIPLAASGSDIQTMGRAVELLDQRWPGHEAASIENQLDLASRAFRAVPRNSSQRGPVGEAYIDLLMGMVQQCSDKNELQQAIDIGRLANTIARSIDSGQRERIGLVLEQLDTENALADRIQMLTLSVEKNPQNKPAARELVDVLLKKRNDPAAASAYVQSTGDEELIELVQFAAKGLDQASAPHAMRVGDWYRVLAEDEEGLYAEQLLSNARAWYARFFSEYTRQDALAKRVEMLDLVSEIQLTKLRESLGIHREGDWTDLIKNQFNPELHAKRGEVRVVENEIQCTPCGLHFPINAEGSYEFEVAFIVMEHGDTEEPMSFLLPVNERFIKIRYNYTGAAVLQGDQDGMRHDVEERGNDLGKTKRLLFRVVSDADGAKIAVMLNGEEVMAWEGKIDGLGGRETFELPEEEEDLVRVSVRNPTIIKTARHRQQK